MKRALGQYSTPLETVHYMVTLALTHMRQVESPKILDPAVGDGVFVEALLKHGVDASSILAMDIDATVVENFTFPCRVEHRDFLLTANGEFDLIIGNPPYKSKRESSYIKDHRSRLEAQFPETGIQNLYSMFIEHAIKNLREGGHLCFIVQDSFLTNVYYSGFRRFLLDNCLIREITLAPRRLFHHTDADVRTTILLLEKCSGEEYASRRSACLMRLVDRLSSESEYFDPPQEKVQWIEQKAFGRMERFNFFVNIPERIINMIQGTEKQLGDVVQGGTGISTGKDSVFLRKVSDLPDHLSQEEMSDWVPFYKNGGLKDAWYYETVYRIHKDWEAAGKLHKDFMTRNSTYYFREGITCSSMGVEFSAAYLPPGCLFGVNANFFTQTQDDLFYVLGLLNSTLAKYMIRAIFNRTNMVTAGYVKRLPYVEPSAERKDEVVRLSQSIVESLRVDATYDYIAAQKRIDHLIFDIYGLDDDDRRHVLKFCENMYEAL